MVVSCIACRNRSPLSVFHKKSLPPVTQIIDLASDAAWQISIDDGPWRAVKVPGGGYNSDIQEEPLINQAAVKDHVTYKRIINIRELSPGKVARIEFGGVNHGCDVYLDGQLIGSHVGPMMPFEFDLTDLIKPGTDHELRVVAYPQWHYSYEVPHGFVYAEARMHPDTKVDFDTESGWASKFSYGITKFVHISICPGIYIQDIFVRPSVVKRDLSIDLWIRNSTDESKSLIIRPELSSWNQDNWNYPKFKILKISLRPGEIRKITAGPVSWKAGPESYWWPNKPFHEDYRARLHNIEVSLAEKKVIVDRKIQRFGFVEWTEGPYYYRVNGIRVNQISDGTPESAMSMYDCYSLSPAFLPPTDTTSGCAETWKRFMRLGISANRIHQSTPTPYMMDMADELGFMLIPETPIRGCQKQNWHKVYLPQSAMELAKTARNHPSVCRYSLQNEAEPEWVPVLIDSINTVDPTRPLVFEDNQIGHSCRIDGKTGHAFAMLHYVEYPRPAKIITGMGEYAWDWTGHAPGIAHAGGGLEEFIYYGADMRLWDISYMAGWDFINYWPNFLEGMDQEAHAWKQSGYPKNRIDKLDGWNSPVVHMAEKYFHPYLVLDTGLHRMNKPGRSFETQTYHPGEVMERNLAIFNDGLSRSSFTLEWEARWDSAGGVPAASGKIREISIEPGFNTIKKLRFEVPESNTDHRKLFLILRSRMGNKLKFLENNIYFWIDRHQTISGTI